MDNFPDGRIGFTEMHEAGIRLEHMYPLEKNRAVELYREGAEVFILNGNPDHPEQDVYKRQVRESTMAVISSLRE